MLMIPLVARWKKGLLSSRTYWSLVKMSVVEVTFMPEALKVLFSEYPSWYSSDNIL